MVKWDLSSIDHVTDAIDDFHPRRLGLVLGFDVSFLRGESAELEIGLHIEHTSMDGVVHELRFRFGGCLAAKLPDVRVGGLVLSELTIENISARQVENARFLVEDHDEEFEVTCRSISINVLR